MNIYNKNLDKLQQYNEFIYENIQEYLENEESDLNMPFEVITTKDGLTTYVIEGNCGRVRLNSVYNQEKEASRWAQQYKVEHKNQLLILFGFGNGIFANELMKVIKEDTILVIIEPSIQLFCKTMELYDLSDLLEHKYLQLLIGKDQEEAYQQVLMLSLNWSNEEACKFFCHPYYDKLFEEIYHTYHKMWGDYRNLIVVNHMTEMAIIKQSNDNFFQNLKLLHKSTIITEEKKHYDNTRPVIIVSAGPSLDKNIMYLKEVKGYAYIVSVDTAVKYLLRHEIIPDIIVTLDPVKWIGHLKDPRCFDVPLFCRIESNYAIVSEFKKIVFFNIDGYGATIFGRAGYLVDTFNAGGSVSTGALSICASMGFETIILVGSDLAYLDDKTHAGNLVVDVADTRRYLETVEDIYGNMIQTRYDWYVYLKWFEETIKSIPSLKVTDATEGGAKIKGTQIRTLKEVVDEIRKEFKVTSFENGQTKVDVDAIIILLHEDLAVLKEMKNRLSKNINLTHKIILDIKKNKNNYNSLLKGIKKNNQWIEEQVIYTLIDWDVVRETREDMKELINQKEETAQSDLEAFQLSLHIYDSMIKSIERFVPKMEEVVATLEKAEDEK